MSTLESTCHCGWEWHLARLRPISRTIYPYAFRLGGGSKTNLLNRRFYPSIATIAEHFDFSEREIRRGLKDLEDLGFLQLIARKSFQPTHYRVLSHTEWAEKHPGQCAVKIEMPWSGEGDPLGQALWKISGGQYKPPEFSVQNLRKLGLDESVIEDQFAAYWEKTGQRMNPKKVAPGFYAAVTGSTTYVGQIGPT